MENKEVIQDMNNNGDNLNRSRPNLKNLAITASAPPPSNNSTMDRPVCPLENKKGQKKKKKIGKKFRVPFRLAVKIDLIQNIVILCLIGVLVIALDLSKYFMDKSAAHLPKKPTCNNWHKKLKKFYTNMIPTAESAIGTLQWTAMALLPKALLSQFFGWIAFYSGSSIAAMAFGIIKGLSAILDLIIAKVFRFNIVPLIFLAMDLLSMFIAFVFGYKACIVRGKKAIRPAMNNV